MKILHYRWNTYLLLAWDVELPELELNQNAFSSLLRSSSLKAFEI
jgi:hypothetical protein